MPPASEAHTKTWQKCTNLLRQQIPKRGYETWIQPLEPVSVVSTANDSCLTLAAPSQFHLDWLDQHYKEILSHTIETVAGKGSTVAFNIATTPHEDNSTKNRPPNMPNTLSVPAHTRAKESPSKRGNLNPSYTFDRFVTGTSNNIAYSAAHAVASNPGGTSFNPFFIHGPVGLGKTHMLHAIGLHALSHGTASNVQYASCEQLTSAFVSAVKSNRTADFALYFKDVDVLLVDDVQFLAGKEKTQSAFCDIFNTLHQAGRQIVLSADRPPEDIESLNKQLLSRFRWGLTMTVDPPDYSTRIAILELKAKEEGMELSDETIQYIASTIHTNVRILEGAIRRLKAYQQLTSQPISPAFAADVLRDYVPHSARAITIDAISDAVATYYEASAEVILGPSRKREIATARHMITYLAAKHTQMSLKAIGRFVGGRHHSTVIHAVRTIEDLLDTEPSVQSALVAIQRKLNLPVTSPES